MNFFWNYLYPKTEKKIESRLSKSSIKKMARRAGITYLTKDLSNSIDTTFEKKCKDIMNDLKKITEHRGGTVIKSKDLEVLSMINNFNRITGNQSGGGYDGWCDDSPGQCMDSRQCGGGYDGWCDDLPGQCMDSRQCGGGYDGWCDDLPGQCMDSRQCGGGIGFLVPKRKFNKILKKNCNSELKLSSKVSDSLQEYVEQNINKRLVFSKKNSTNGVRGINDVFKKLQ